MMTMRGLLRSGSTLLLLTGLLAGCDGCKDKPKVGSPLQFVPQDADAVLEIRDLGLLIKAREGIAKQFASVMPPKQLASLQKEFERAFGFDPTTAEGLAKAGLPSTGPVAANVLGSGRGAVWIIPVADTQKLEPNLLKIVKARASVDETKTETVGKHQVTVYLTQFGADTIPVAAHTFAKGFVLIAAGRKSVDLLEAALAVTDKTSVTNSAEYKALVGELGDDWDARMISPRGSETLQGALKTAARSVPAARALAGAKLDGVASVGWSAKVSSVGLKVQGKLRLDDNGKKLAKELFAAVGEPSPGVRAIAIPEAVVFAQMALHPKTVMDILAPVGSPARSRIDRAQANAKRDANIDFEGDILPLLNGHASIAMGVGGLDKVSFQELVGNPRSILWTAGALGVEKPAEAVEIEKRLDPGLKKMGFAIVERAVKDKAIRSVVPPKDPTEPENPAPMVETSGFGGAWVFANEGPLMNRVVDNTTGANALGGTGGVFVELNFRELNKQISTFRYGNLPVLYRSLLAKVLDAVKLLDGAKIRIQPDPAGVAMSAELTIVPVGAK